MKHTLFNPIATKKKSRTSAIALAFVLLAMFGLSSSVAQVKNQKRVTSVRLGSASAGSRVTVVSDSALNDYEAYRRGDRFYVKIPAADFASAVPNFRGAGFEDVQVQKAADSAVISFRLQPGTAARVDQRSNRLDVVFSTSGRSQNAGGNVGQPAASTGSFRDGRDSTYSRHRNRRGERISTPEEAAAGSQSASSGSSSQADVPASSSGSSSTAAGSPSETTSSPQSLSPAPQSRASDANQRSATQTVPPSSGSAGQWVVRNWLVVSIAALLASLAFLLVMYLRSTRKKTNQAIPLSLETNRIQNKLEPAPSNSVLHSREAKTLIAEKPLSNTAVPFERIDHEVTKLLAGEKYDTSVINAADSATRQMIAAQLLTALGDRSFEHHEHARQAFLNHGYFDQATRDLRTADSPAERAAAASSLGTFGNSLGTTHLIAALHDNAPEVRRSAVESLAKIGDPTALSALDDLLLRETSREVPDAVIRHAINSISVAAAPTQENLASQDQEWQYDAPRFQAHEGEAFDEFMVSRETKATEIADVASPPSITTPPPATRDGGFAELEARLRLQEEALTRAAEELERRRLEAEGVRKKAEEEAQLKAANEERARANAEAQLRAEEEARRAEQEARRQAEEARLRAEAEARLRAEHELRERSEEEARLRAEEEARFRLEAETLRRAAEELARRRAEAEAARRLAQEETQRRAEEARERVAEETRRRAQEEAQRQAKEVLRRRVEEEMHRRVEARRLAEEEARRRAEEERQQLEAEERRRVAEERLQMEQEALMQAAVELTRRRAEVEEARRRAEEEARLLLQAQEQMRAADEQRRLIEEERQRLEAEARRRLEEEQKSFEEARLRAEEEQKCFEEARLRAEEEQKRFAEARLRAEEEQKSFEEARLRAEEEQKRFEEQARLRAEEEGQRLAELDAVRKQAEQTAYQRAEQEQRIRAEIELLRQAEQEQHERIEAETRRRAESEARLKEEEALRQAEEEALLRVEQEVRQQAEEARLRAEEELRFNAEAEARLREEEARRQAEEAARLQAEHEARLREEEARRQAEEEAQLQAEWEARLREEEARRQAEEEARLQAERESHSIAEEARLWPEQETQSSRQIQESFLEINLVHKDKGFAQVPVDSSIPSDIFQRLNSNDSLERAAALAELATMDGDDAFTLISRAFDDASVDVRNAAAHALYEMQSDRAASFTRALREASPERRRRIGAAVATSGLANNAISNLTGETREKTYDAFSLLFLMAKAGEVQPLMQAIEDHANVEVRLAVVKLLALSGQAQIVPAFRRLAVRGSLPSEVRSAVMEAIYQISSQARESAHSAA